MNTQAIENLMTRRSCRAYKPEQITDEELKTVLDAGTYAPTGHNTQSPVIVAVQNRAERDAVAALNASVVNMKSDPYYGAPTIVLVLAKDDDFAQLNGSAVEMNMLNAAHAAGLGSCWIHRCEQMFRTAEGKALLKKWGLDEDLVGVASLSLGYPAAPAAAPAPRKENYYTIIK